MSDRSPLSPLALDYFRLFGLAPSFQVDVQQLMERYYTLQRQFHPDRYLQATESVRQSALQHAATINHGLRTLKDPLLRAEYLLMQQGVIAQDDQSTLFQDDAFLTQQLALRETFTTLVAQCAQRADHKTAQQLSDFAQQITTLSNRYTQQLASDLEKRQWEQAKKRLYRLKLVTQLQKQTVQLQAQYHAVQLK